MCLESIPFVRTLGQRHLFWLIDKGKIRPHASYFVKKEIHMHDFVHWKFSCFIDITGILIFDAWLDHWFLDFDVFVDWLWWCVCYTDCCVESLSQMNFLLCLVLLYDTRYGQEFYCWHQSSVTFMSGKFIHLSIILYSHISFGSFTLVVSPIQILVNLCWIPAHLIRLLFIELKFTLFMTLLIKEGRLSLKSCFSQNQTICWN